jgi:hypothetical protein
MLCKVLTCVVLLKIFLKFCFRAVNVIKRVVVIPFTKINFGNSEMAKIKAILCVIDEAIFKVR